MIRVKVGISPYHLQCGMPQYLLQGEDIASIAEELGGERMPAQMSVQALDTCSLCQSVEHQLHGVITHLPSEHR